MTVARRGRVVGVWVAVVHRGRRPSFGSPVRPPSLPGGSSRPHGSSVSSISSHISSRVVQASSLAMNSSLSLTRTIVSRACRCGPGWSGRRHEQEDHADVLAVDAVERDAGLRQAEGADQPRQALVPGVGDGHAAADAGRPEALAAEDLADDRLDLLRPEVPGLPGGPRPVRGSPLPWSWRPGPGPGRPGPGSSSCAGPPRPKYEGQSAGSKSRPTLTSASSTLILALPPVLDLFLVPVDLVLDPVHRQVHGGHQLLVLVVGDEVVLVLGVDQDLDLLVDLVGRDRPSPRSW